MGSGDNITTDILEWLYISIVKLISIYQQSQLQTTDA